MGKCYVYEHWRPDKNLPFYVGKGGGGNGNRHQNFKPRNKRYARVIRELTRLGMCAEVRLFKSGLSQKAAFAIEKERIAFWRGKGVKLANIAKGGQGSSGWKHSEEWKKANGDRMRGRKDPPAVRRRKKLAAKRRPPPSKPGRKKIARTVKALWADPAYRAQLLAAHAERPPISKSTRRKMRAAQRARRENHKVSANTRAKVSATIKEWHRKMGHKIS